MECERDLAEAIPALEHAIEALHTLKQSDISLLKTLNHPPHGIILVMEAVCILLGEQPDRVPDPDNLGSFKNDYWPRAQKILSDLHFLLRLKKFNKDKIPQGVMDSIRSK